MPSHSRIKPPYAEKCIARRTKLYTTTNIVHSEYSASQSAVMVYIIVFSIPLSKAVFMASETVNPSLLYWSIWR